MPSRVLETVLTGRNLLSPVLTTAARDVEGFDAKVSAANARASESSAASARTQETSAAKITAANARNAETASASSTRVVAANARAAESARLFADASETAAVRSGAAYATLATKGLPLLGAAAAFVSGKMAADFQTLTTRLETTAGESHKNLGMVGQGMLDMAGQVGFSANTLAKAMYTVDSANIHGADSLKVLKAGAEGARQEGADLSKVVDALTTALHDYNLPASDATKVTSQMVEAVSHGKTTFDQLTGSLHSVTPLAAALHVPLSDILADVAAMTASGESADQSTQNLADTLRHLQKPTSTMTGELAQLGITSGDLSEQLSTKGLSGTIQGIETAIVQHMDPATRKVLLPALNQSRTAVQDLQTMIGQMPPSLAKLSASFLAGRTSLTDYRKDARDLGGQQAAMGTQFLSLVTSSQGFNNVLKAGGPQAQAFSAALQAAMGDSAGLTVALQLTGEHAAVVNQSIKDISKSSGDAHGNVQGWAEVQGTLNQQLAEAGGTVSKLAIEFGQHLLPAASSAMGFINRDVLPGIGHLGSIVGTLGHDFMALPEPIRNVALAFAAFKIAASINFLGISSGITAMKTAYAGFQEEMAVQQALWAMEQRSASATAATYGETTVAVEALTAAEAEQTVALGGMNVATGTLAARGIAGVKAAGAGLTTMLTGWGATTVVAAAGVYGLVRAFTAESDEIKANTQYLLDNMKAQTQAGQPGQDAIHKVQAYQQHIDQLSTSLANMQSAVKSGGAGLGIHANALQVDGRALGDQKKALADARREMAQYMDSLAPVDRAQAEVGLATNKLNDAMAHNPANSQAVKTAAQNLASAQRDLAIATSNANEAAQTQIQKMQAQANTALGLVDAQRAAQQSQLQLGDAIAQYNADAKDGQHSSQQLKEETLGLVDSAEQAAKAAGDAAAKQAGLNKASDTGAASQGAFLQSLQNTAGQLTGPAKQAVLDMIKTMGGQQTQAEITAGAINQLGITVTDLPKQHFIEIDAPTGKQMKDLHDLGYETVTLPDGHVVVTVDTHPARAEIVDLLNYARQQSILYRATLPDLNGAASGSGRPGLATGGWVRGPGGPTSDSVPLMGSNGEFMVKAARARENAGLLEDINAGRVRGYASGGWIGLSPDGTWPAGGATIPVHVQDGGYMTAVHHYLSSLAASFGSGGSGGLRPLGRMIADNMGLGAQFGAIDYIFTRESGWNPAAQNPTSTAFGIPQFLASTWAAYGGRTTDPTMQIRDGIEYMVNRYGSPNSAAAFWAAHHWYDQGGILPPGVTLAVNGTGQNETIRTAGQEDTLQRALAGATGYTPTGFTAAAMPGYGAASTGGGIDYDKLAAALGRHIGNRSYTAQVTNTGTPVTPQKLMATFHEMEFLSGP